VCTGVVLGLLPIWWQLANAFFDIKARLTLETVLASGVLAVPSVSIAAGALSQQVIKCGVHRRDFLQFILVLLVIFFGTGLYAKYSVDTLTLSNPGRLANQDIWRLSLTYGMVFAGAVIGGGACVYRSVTAKEPPS